jgi:PASTA domain
MVNAFGYYASAKGMVLVPDLSGLSSAAAISLLESSGLNYSLGSDIDTNNSALDNLVAEQSPVSNTLVDYETVVQFRLYNLVVIPPFFPFFPSFPPSVALTATSTGQTTTQLSWTASNFTQASYQITRNGDILGGGPVNGTTTSGTDSGLQCGVNYAYTITLYSGPDGTGSSISDSESVTTDACTNLYTVNYECNGGTGCPSDTTHNGTFTITGSAPTFSGFTFNGYHVYCNSSFIGNYQPGDTVSCGGNLEIQAQWSSVAPFFPFFPFFPTFQPTIYGTGCCADGATVTDTSTSEQVLLDSLETKCLNRGSLLVNSATSLVTYPTLNC